MSTWVCSSVIRRYMKQIKDVELIPSKQRRLENQNKPTSEQKLWNVAAQSPKDRRRQLKCTMTAFVLWFRKTASQRKLQTRLSSYSRPRNVRCKTPKASSSWRCCSNDLQSISGRKQHLSMSSRLHHGLQRILLYFVQICLNLWKWKKVEKSSKCAF